MALFQNSVIQKHLISQDENKLIAAYNKLKVYQARAKGISGYKEEEYQDGFLRDVFVNVLGYTYKYDGYPTFNLLREKKNVNDSKKADGAILKDGEVICVIESALGLATRIHYIHSSIRGFSLRRLGDQLYIRRRRLWQQQCGGQPGKHHKCAG